MAENLAMILTIVGLAVAVVATLVVIVAVYARMPLEKKYEGSGGGLGGAFDAVWMPSAHEAGIERDRQTKRTTPAPAPGDPPNGIQGSRIILDL